MSMIADLFKAKLTAKPAKRTGLKEGSPLGCVDESSECRIPANRCGDARGVIDASEIPQHIRSWRCRRRGSSASLVASAFAFAALSVGIILWNAVKLYS